MKRSWSVGIASVLLLLPSIGQAVAEAPAIRTSETNKVPACVTPGRLVAFLRGRNTSLDPRFEKISVEYMRRGEELGLRWDYAFFQMVLETGYLTYRGDRGRRGDVSPRQNNFAGLGATGRGNPGESFPDVATGVLAHLQHVLLYAGETIENPVAERTRKVQEWGILNSLKRKARGEITFAHLATKWAPGSDYVAGLEALAEKFEKEHCNAADPHPEWVAEARGNAQTKVAGGERATTGPGAGAELARRAIEEGDGKLTGLGAGNLAKAAAAPAASPPQTPSYSVLNRPQQPGSKAAPVVESSPKSPLPPVVNASAAGAMAAAPGKAGAPATKSSCRVWTASYGGLKALIIKVQTAKGTDYTVLDVNEGREKREAEAYISAYAKGGEIAGEFKSQTQALDKAFELCPEK